MRDEKKSTSQNKQYMFFCVMGIASVDSNVLLWSDSLLLPRPSQSGYTFERDPSRVKSMQIKDVGLVSGHDSTAHLFIHTSVHGRGTPRVGQEPRSQKERKTVPILAKPTILRGNQEKIMAIIYGLT